MLQRYVELDIHTCMTLLSGQSMFWTWASLAVCSLDTNQLNLRRIILLSAIDLIIITLIILLLLSLCCLLLFCVLFFMIFVDNCGDSCLDWQENYFDWQSLGIGRNLTFLAVQTVFFWLLIIMIETDIIRKILYKCRPKIQLADELYVQFYIVILIIFVHIISLCFVVWVVI